MSLQVYLLTTPILILSFLSASETASGPGISCGARAIFGFVKAMAEEVGAASVKIQEVRNVHHEKRVASHSHINGLGLNDEGFAFPTAGGFVGQAAAREVSILAD